MYRGIFQISVMNVIYMNFKLIACFMHVTFCRIFAIHLHVNENTLGLDLIL